jgi:hypothetical protein
LLFQVYPRNFGNTAALTRTFDFSCDCHGCSRISAGFDLQVRPKSESQVESDSDRVAQTDVCATHNEPELDGPGPGPTRSPGPSPGPTRFQARCWPAGAESYRDVGNGPWQLPAARTFSISIWRKALAVTSLYGPGSVQEAVMSSFKPATGRLEFRVPAWHWQVQSHGSVSDGSRRDKSKVQLSKFSAGPGTRDRDRSPGTGSRPHGPE